MPPPILGETLDKATLLPSITVFFSFFFLRKGFNEPFTSPFNSLRDLSINFTALVLLSFDFLLPISAPPPLEYLGIGDPVLIAVSAGIIS